ncbi:ran-binding protein 3-like isoform X4 [Mustela putorius furo]|uniref:Ran-binding protein 3-like isoform X4 n=1 Tax=Mustela putorius furo TaxID=9669 RepID=A0A8U0MDN9_MUSPF|nr:ran-binding protein 3-like isoform X4 [Mustela putorius furo]
MSTVQRKGSSHLFNSSYICKLKLPQDQRPQEKSVIAQPVFVFAKRENTFKRPAEDTFEAAEHESNDFLRKRARSSSFTLHTTDPQFQGASTLSQNRMRSSSFTNLLTFPPSGPVKKNNVFMTSTLVQRNVDMNSTEQGPVKHSDHVLRPAVLQPPQAQRCEKLRKTFVHNTLESCKTKEKTKNKISEGNSSLLSENLPSARISVQLTTSQNCLGATSVGCQAKEDKYSFKSCSSDFVFGENMVERVLDTQHLTHSQLENDSYTKEKPFKSTLEFPVNSPNSIMRNQGSLRLILNSKLWAQMEIQRANHKNLRITATDLEDYSIKVFLIQASAKDTGCLYAAIHHRLLALRSFNKQKDVNQAESQSEAILQQLNCESCDEDEDDFLQVTKNRSDPSRWTHRQSVACS